ncbi:dipeptide epimerase [Thalassotalea mangrovi]|uniref:Dipeptide epimerase n=1 Tax=Thalassotalea mangrovi TaxID=2572245 RepID=A0A4U1B256_9GAMM|nr:dipeptide epimerase [Thalassotalea mangrovi]TKB43533.1 dipeptide epimerase [Thalassotalea mangrovi]
MKLKNLRLGQLKVPLVTPFKTALRSVDHVHDVIVEIELDNGMVGYGSAPATAVITGDTHGSILCAVKDFIWPAIANMDIWQLNSICERIARSMVHNSSAKAAVEMAIYDLWAQALGVPLYQALGGGLSQLKTDITISVNEPAVMVADAQKAVAQGYDTLKLKVGKDLQQDIERIRAIAAAVGDDIQLRLDANQGWTAKQCISALNAMENAGLTFELVEQPVASDDLVGLKACTEQSTAAIMADESAFSVSQSLALMANNGCDIINIKLMKSAGIFNALTIADSAGAYRMPCMMGCMLESSIGVAAAAHVASARHKIIGKIDLDAAALCQYDPVEGGVQFNHSDIILNQTPGLGIRKIETITYL